MARGSTVLDGKTVYLVSDGFPGADHFLAQVGNLVQEEHAQRHHRIPPESRRLRGRRSQAECRNQGQGPGCHHGHRALKHLHTSDRWSLQSVRKDGIPAAPLVTIAFKDLAQIQLRKAWHAAPTHFLHTASGLGQDGRADVRLPRRQRSRQRQAAYERSRRCAHAASHRGGKEDRHRHSSGRRATFTDTADKLQQYFLDNGMTDSMPIVIPTQERVDAMLKGTSHKPDEVVGKMTPAQGAFPAWSFTVQHCAINAVMAGATPEYFPTILAIASTGISALFSSTNSLVLRGRDQRPDPRQAQHELRHRRHGPVQSAERRHRPRVDAACPETSMAAESAAKPTWARRATCINYSNLIIPENEKDSPWPPFHVQKGFKPEENVISFFFGFCITQGQGGKGLGVKPVRSYNVAMSANVAPVRLAFRRALPSGPAGGQRAWRAWLQNQGSAGRLAPEKHDCHRRRT